MLQLDTRRTTCRVKEVYKSSQTPPFPLSPWLRSCLDLLCDVQVSVLQYCFAPDVCKIQRPLNLSCPTPPPHVHLLWFLWFSICIYLIVFLLVRSNDNSRMLFSVFAVFPAGTVGRLAGDVLHIPWAQDLLTRVVLWKLCDTAGLVCLPSRAECIEHGLKTLCNADSNVTWGRRIASQNQLVTHFLFSWPEYYC